MHDDPDDHDRPRGPRTAPASRDTGDPLRTLIGILAGMGPRSTSPFLEKVLDECVRQYGATLDSDFPPMMIHSLPTPFTLGAPLDHDAMRRSIRGGLDRLVETGVGVIAIPCNVAHLYFDDLVRGHDTPVLNLIEATADAVPREATAVTVLATRPTLEAGIYQAALEARGRGIRDPAPYQARVDGLIDGVKRSRPAEALNQAWRALVDELLQDGIDCVLLGSTDLSPIPATVEEERLTVVDSGAALARELVARWRRSEGIPEGDPARNDGAPDR